MSIQQDFIAEKQRQLLYRQLAEEAERDFSVSKLDIGRQHDVMQCLMAINTSKNPAEIAQAKKALRFIYMEYRDKTLRDARKWLMNEREHGRHDNVKNFYEDVEKNAKVYNPYGTQKKREW